MDLLGQLDITKPLYGIDYPVGLEEMAFIIRFIPAGQLASNYHLFGRTHYS
jgi:hypothetical protein